MVADKVADMEVDKVADMVAYMVVDKVADMLADKEIIMLIIGRLGFGGVSQMLTIDDEGGGEVQEPLILADLICQQPLSGINELSLENTLSWVLEV